MSAYLLDTHLLLWTTFKPSQLSEAAKLLVNDPSNQLAFSSVSIWEITIKRGLKKPGFSFDPALLRSTLLAVGYREIDITSEHAIQVATLPLLHKDPFDRLLLAQAQIEGITLLTADPMIAAYSHPVQLI